LAFQKIKNFGIFRTTLSKKGIGTSVGIPRLHFGVSHDGHKYFSFGIPKTGLYYIKYFEKNKKLAQNTESKQIKINKITSITDKF
jgi:hypothetical protein